MDCDHYQKHFRINEMKIIIRQFDPTLDAGFVYATFPKGVYYSAINDIKTPKDKWFKDFYSYTKNILGHAAVNIASTDNCVDTIIGYVIIKGTELEWIYVKELFRKQGVAKLLLKNVKIESVNKNNLTKVGASILIKHPELDKGETNEQVDTIGSKI
jgi:hypothetical protein